MYAPRCATAPKLAADLLSSRLTVGQASMPSFRGVVISACALCDRFFREMAFLLNINIRTHAFVAERTDYESVAIRGFAGLFGQSGVPDDVEIHSACERACCTISTKTFRVSAGLFTSRKNAMRAPRMPSRVFIRT